MLAVFTVTLPCPACVEVALNWRVKGSALTDLRRKTLGSWPLRRLGFGGQCTKGRQLSRGSGSKFTGMFSWILSWELGRSCMWECLLCVWELNRLREVRQSWATADWAPAQPERINLPEFLEHSETWKKSNIKSNDYWVQNQNKPSLAKHKTMPAKVSESTNNLSWWES